MSKLRYVKDNEMKAPFAHDIVAAVQRIMDLVVSEGLALHNKYQQHGPNDPNILMSFCGCVLENMGARIFTQFFRQDPYSFMQFWDHNQNLIIEEMARREEGKGYGIPDGRTEK